MKNLLLLLLNKTTSTYGYVYAETGYKNTARAIVEACPAVDFVRASMQDADGTKKSWIEENTFAYHICMDAMQNSITHIDVLDMFTDEIVIKVWLDTKTVYHITTAVRDADVDAY
jgi:hypothetical protein